MSQRNASRRLNRASYFSTLVMLGHFIPLVALGCGGAETRDHATSGNEGPTDESGATTGVSSMGELPGTNEPSPDIPPTATPSGYLLLSAERLAELDALVAANDPKWLGYKQFVDGHLGEINKYSDSAENRALVYLLTDDPAYAHAAYAFAEATMEEESVSFDSYLHFGDLMRQAAIVLNYCGPALTAEQRAVLIDYLDSWTHELWFDNQGSGWGLDDPGNNYHHAFLQGTAYAGYALREAGAPSAEVYIDRLLQEIEEPGGVIDYLADEVVGGGWREGTNYGERSKQRLDDTLAVVASMSGRNFLFESPFTAASVRYAIFEIQPDQVSLYPGGDLARDSAMFVTPAERDYLMTARFWLGSGDSSELAKWYLDNVAPTFDVSSYRPLMFKEMVFGSDGASKSPDTLPLGYLAPGTGWINLRSSWDATATSLTISAPDVIDQSHQHMDVGSFVIFKRGWLALDATSKSYEGLNWTSCAHNGICVEGQERRLGPVGGVTAFEDDDGVAYIAVDATDQYRHRPASDTLTMMEEHTREMLYIRPNTLVIYDRVVPKSGTNYHWRIHLPAAPTAAGSGYSVASAGAGLTVVPLLGQVLGVESDVDLPDGASLAFRLETAPVNPADGRLLHVVAVANGSAPALDAKALSTNTGDMQGAVLPNTVVLFSRASGGAAPSLPFAYTVDGTQPRLHVLANLDQAVDVSVTAGGGQTHVSVSAGSAHQPSSSGTLRLQL